MIFETGYSIPIQMEKSRSDDILLTGGFNHRTKDAGRSLQVPQGRHFEEMTVSSLRDFEGRSFRLIRRLKPPVSKVPSLRDYSPFAQYCYIL